MRVILRQDKLIGGKDDHKVLKEMSSIIRNLTNAHLMLLGNL